MDWKKLAEDSEQHVKDYMEWSKNKELSAETRKRMRDNAKISAHDAEWYRRQIEDC